MGMKFTGVKELRVALKKKADLGAVRKVVALNGSELQTKAQRNAPFDTGTLKRSIRLEMKDNGLTAKTEATAEYAPYVEHGTRYQEAQPYMGPAFNEQKAIFKRDLDRLMR